MAKKKTGNNHDSQHYEVEDLDSMTDKIVKGLDCGYDVLSYRLPPGPAFIPLNWVVNTQKFGCWIFVLALMIYHNNFSTGAWMYLTIHGSYGMTWFMKDLIFPDASFQRKVTLPSALVASTLLAFYLLPGYQMASGIADQNPSTERILVAFLSYVLGQFMMAGADIQKYYTVKYKKGLINNGYFKLTRNPNYLGEVLIYNSFAIITNRWEFWIVLGVIDLAFFLPRMLIKDVTSLKKKKGWKEYDSYLFFPKFSSCCLDNLLIYAFLFGSIIVIHSLGGFAATYENLHKAWATNDHSHICDAIHQSDFGRAQDYVFTHVKTFIKDLQ